MNRSELSEGIKTALKAHDKVRLMTLRSVLAEVKNLEVDTHAEATEQQVNDMVKRVLKQANETLLASEKAADNPERTEEYRTRVAILESCLPVQLAGAELEAAVKAAVAETGASSKRDMGRIMGLLSEKTGGNFDKAAAAKIAGSLLG